MRYCDVMSLILNGTISSFKLMEKLREAIMQEKKKHRRFYTLGCGGQHCVRIRKHIAGCDACQRTGRPSQRDDLPLNPQLSLQPFEKWVIDFVGPIQPPGKKTSAWYIITATKYLTRWAEAQPMTDCIGTTIAKFQF